MGFLEEYFIDPIISGTGYNIVNTITYAVILIVSLFVLIKILRKLEIKLDRKLWYDVLPFVLLGGVLRALQDAGFFASLGAFQYILITPFIYILVFAIAFCSLLISKYTKHDVTGNVGLFLLVFFAMHVVLNAINVIGFLIVLCLTFLVFFSVYFALKLLKTKVLFGINWMPFFGHALDSCSSTTAILIVGGYAEQHVVPGFIFSFVPFWFFIPLKVLIVLLALYIIDKEVKGNIGTIGSDWNWMLKFTVFVLGIGPGLRNTLTILLGTSL